MDGGDSGGPSFVAVIQPADLRERRNFPWLLPLDGSRLGRVLPEEKFSESASGTCTANYLNTICCPDQPRNGTEQTFPSPPTIVCVRRTLDVPGEEPSHSSTETETTRAFRLQRSRFLQWALIQL
jgi:hypothetical protein